MKCYQAAIESTHKPNPQELLTHVSRATKQALSKLGLFSVTSFVCYTNTRNLSSVSLQDHKATSSSSTTRQNSRMKSKNINNNTSASGSSGIKARLLSSLKIADDSVVTAIRSRHSTQNVNKQTK